MRRFRTALVGCGRIGLSYAEDPLTRRYFEAISHGQVLLDHPRFDLCAAVDVRSDALERARVYGIRSRFVGIREMSRQISPEVVVLATPPSSRIEQIRELGDVRAIVCEKPLSKSIEGARDVVDECRRRGVPLVVNYWRRFDPTMRTLAATLPTQVGRVQGAHIVYGGGLMTNGSHVIDLVRMLIGEIEAVTWSSPVSMESRRGEWDPDYRFSLAMKSGASVHGTAIDFSKYREVYLDIWGIRGRVEIIQEGLFVVSSPVSRHRAITGLRELTVDDKQTSPTEAGVALRYLYDNLAACLSEGTDLLCPGDEALASERVVFEIMRRRT